MLRSSPTAQAVTSLAVGQIPGSGLPDAGRDLAGAYTAAGQGNYMSAAGSAAMGIFGVATEWPGIKTIKGLLKGGKAVDKLGDAKKAAELKKLEDAKKAADAKKAKEAQEARQSGPVVEKKKKVKRKPKRRCELVPYDELECETGQEAHHVVPDWMLRMGKRGGADRIPEMPSLAGGPAICLEGGSGNEHNTAHKHTDRPAQRIGRSGKATGVAGTITLGQGKAISSRAIEKATGGKKGGGCDREDIQKQLDEKFKAQNDALLRGVKDSRKVTDTIKDALNGGKD